MPEISYTLINYKEWIFGDEARKGVNIKRQGLLNPEEVLIFDKAFPYQDSRNDPGHGEMTAYFILKLLDNIPGKREITVPAGILHDIGWYGNDPNAWRKLVEEHKDNLQALESEAMRRPHQNRGLLLTGRILEQTGYFKKYSFENWLEIADIIGDHDTRKLPATENGKILRAADLLWRVTLPNIRLYMNGWSQEKILKTIEENCLSKELLPHLGEIGEKIARIELRNTLENL